MKKTVFLCFVLILIATQVGCWDQMMLKDMNLIFSIGVDPTKDNKIKSTASIPLPTGEGSEPTVKIATGIGNTLRESRMDMDTLVAGITDSSQIQVLLVNKELAQIDLYSMLDLYYRDPRAPLNCKVAITNEPAADIIKLNIQGNEIISNYLEDLIKGAETQSIVPVVNIQFICPVMLDEGRDFSVPFMSVDNSEDQQFARIIGTALFNGSKMTGELNLEESTMANLLTNNFHHTARFTVQVNGMNSEMSVMNYIVLEVEDIERTFDVIVNENEGIKVKVGLTSYFNVIEYPPDDLGDRPKTKELNEIISKELSKLATTTVEKLQEANCDLLGIGREIIAYHHDVWEDGKWNDRYPNIPIEVEVKAEIRKHGIIN